MSLSAIWVVAALTLGAGPSVPLDPLDDWKNTKDREHDSPLSELRLINYFFTRLSYTNLLGDPSGLKGVALGPVGSLSGSSVQAGPGTESFYVEQRWIPVLEYAPWFVDDLAAFRAQFEVDFMWGFAANALQQNQGGGFNADQVNLQTKNVNVSFYPTRRPRELAIVIGTQSLYDVIDDPAQTSLLDIVRSGYKLAFVGSDATGISIYSGLWGKSRLALMPLGAAQPDRATQNDARLKFAWLGMLDESIELMPGTHVGASLWWLHDDTKGAAYAYEGLVASGPSSRGLAGFTGTPRLNIDASIGNVYFAGVNFQHNLQFNTGPFAASGFFMTTGGEYLNTRTNSGANPKVSLLGFAGNLELLFNYGRTLNDLVTLETMVTSGDSDLGDSKYSGVFTMNFYGLPGAVWFNHKTLLLFPFTSTVNNYTGAVTDISNQGYGLTSAILTAAYDLVPHVLNLKLGTAAATANANPALTVSGVQPGRFMGVEVNAELRWNIRYLMTIGLHGAYMFLGDFYAGNDRVTSNPYALFTTFTWYAF
jgi:hypothetical protein